MWPHLPVAKSLEPGWRKGRSVGLPEGDCFPEVPWVGAQASPQGSGGTGMALESYLWAGG